MDLNDCNVTIRAKKVNRKNKNFRNMINMNQANTGKNKCWRQKDEIKLIFFFINILGAKILLDPGSNVLDCQVSELETAISYAAMRWSE